MKMEPSFIKNCTEIEFLEKKKREKKIFEEEPERDKKIQEEMQ